MELLYITLIISLIVIILLSIWEDEYTRWSWLKMFVFCMIPIVNIISLIAILLVQFKSKIESIERWWDKPLKRKKNG